MPTAPSPADLPAAASPSPAAPASAASSTALRPPTDAEWQAIEARDATADGAFVFAVETTGVFCRPSCPARRPLRAHVHVGDIAAARRAGFRACQRCVPEGLSSREALDRAVECVRRHLDIHARETVRLADLAALAGVSAGHLQRAFTARIGVSPHAYQTAQRLEAARAALAGGETVAAAAVDAGFGSPRAIYDRAADAFGMTPGALRKGGAGEAVVYGIGGCTLGFVVVARTTRGLCALAFGDDETSLADLLHRQFPRAARTRDDRALSPVLDAVRRALGQKQTHAAASDAPDALASSPFPLDAVPLDVQGTAFQQRVWAALRAIPPGETRTYGAIAAAIGQPSAVRAVATACASNRIALAIPCHRVVPQAAPDSVGGYRWGPARKVRILAAEAQAVRGTGDLFGS